jgi:hypothetical protein
VNDLDEVVSLMDVIYSDAVTARLRKRNEKKQAPHSLISIHLKRLSGVCIGNSPIHRAPNGCSRTRTDTNLVQIGTLQIAGTTSLFKSCAKTKENRVFFEKTYIVLPTKGISTYG